MTFFERQSSRIGMIDFKSLISSKGEFLMTFDLAAINSYKERRSSLIRQIP